MGINSRDLIERVASHAMSLGYFDRVNQHEPKNGPGRGLTCAVWINRIEGTSARSGLAKTSARVEFNVRVYLNMIQEPQDMIDPDMMEATDALLEAYTGDFTLGGTIAAVDVMGMAQRHPMGAEAGYINIDNKVYRVMTITLPVLVDDAWSQTP